MTDNNNGNDDGIHVTKTIDVEVRQPGLLGVLVEKLKRNPIKTSIAGSLGIGAAALGGLNYRRYGAVMPDRVTTDDVGTVARAAFAFFR